jgi:hypothetical protein
MSDSEFSVYQFFQDDEIPEAVRRFVGMEEAFKAFRHYTECVGARIGTTVRVIVTDGGDITVFEWKAGEGLTWPPRGPDGKFVAGVEKIVNGG